MKTNQKSVYLDTTIPSYYYDKRKSLSFQSKMTRHWWRENSKEYAIYISKTTIDELSLGHYPNQAKLLKFVSKILYLKPVDEIVTISKYYIDNYLMPNDLEGDAMHLAYASFYQIDFLLTWNCNHLANANKKQHIRAINTKLSLSIPEIITPLELFKETEV